MFKCICANVGVIKLGGENCVTQFHVKSHAQYVHKRLHDISHPPTLFSPDRFYS